MILNRAIPLFLAGLAVAVAFRMGLFNIGVEGQYRLATIVAAAVGAAVALPGPLHVAADHLVAMVVGALWAGIVAVLKVTRGVSEVISSIMLNFIALGAGVLPAHRAVPGQRRGRHDHHDRRDPRVGLVPRPQRAVRRARPGRAAHRALRLPARRRRRRRRIAVLLKRTRFGFDLRATGLSPSAATASGVDARGMVIKTMLLSGAVAGLIGLPDLLGDTHAFGTEFTAGLGFLGIAVALLGRNTPLGIAFAALLFAFLDRAALPLQFADIPSSVVTIIQGTIVLAVVIANEIARRLALRSAERAGAAAAAAGRGGRRRAARSGPAGTAAPTAAPAADERQGAQA